MTGWTDKGIEKPKPKVFIFSERFGILDGGMLFALSDWGHLIASAYFKDDDTYDLAEISVGAEIMRRLGEPDDGNPKYEKVFLRPDRIKPLEFFEAVHKYHQKK